MSGLFRKLSMFIFDVGIGEVFIVVIRFGVEFGFIE